MEKIEAAETDSAAETEADLTEDLEKCIRLPAQTAVRKLKFHSSHLETDLFIARNATRTTRSQETSKFFNKN